MLLLSAHAKLSFGLSRSGQLQQQLPQSLPTKMDCSGPHRFPVRIIQHGWVDMLYKQSGWVSDKVRFFAPTETHRLFCLFGPPLGASAIVPIQAILVQNRKLVQQS